MNEDFWAQWTTPGTITYDGPDDFKCELAPRKPADDSPTVRIDAAGIYHTRRFKGGILVSKEEFANRGSWENYAASKFYAWCAKNRY